MAGKLLIFSYLCKAILKQFQMIRNHLKIAWRNLLAYKTFSFVNIAGLGIGIASCLALLLYVRYEWNYDKQFSNYRNIYRVYENQ
jgi:putative ABC transport system permease protein